MGAPAEFHLADFVAVIAKNFQASRADKSEIGLGVQNEDQVREAVHKSVGKFLLLVQAAFNFAAFGNVHQRALIANHRTGGIANCRSGVQTSAQCSVLSLQSNFTACQYRLLVHFVANVFPQRLIGKDIGDFFSHQLRLGAITENPDQRRIGIENIAVRRNDVDAFLQSFE